MTKYQLTEFTGTLAEHEELLAKGYRVVPKSLYSEARKILAGHPSAFIPNPLESKIVKWDNKRKALKKKSIVLDDEAPPDNLEGE